MKNLYIIRGVSGSGKTTLAESLVKYHNMVEADQYFIQEDGTYKWDWRKLNDAHQWCFDTVAMLMEVCESQIAVCNTFTRKREVKKYIQLAQDYGYRYHVITVENYHGGKTTHDVPEKTIQKQANRFELQLTNDNN